ncbi:hypothetical protein IWQ62_001826 [Dispira parvispora]|uniref:DUF2470 domain-containing protein n=1 Tax=Dispira parvispora TaxID=1520584 RepID=A0A9W8ASP6_9FUNG|nr:hypothetical protein IWQ62_001826 [Dispira parvispora]
MSTATAPPASLRARGKTRHSRDPIAQASETLLPSLNQRYASVLPCLCQYFGESTQAHQPSIVDIDSHGFTLAYHPVLPKDDQRRGTDRQEVRVVFRNPAQGEDDLAVYFTELVDEARTGVVKNHMNRVPKHRQMVFYPPDTWSVTILSVLLLLLAYLNLTTRAIYPLNIIQEQLGHRKLFGIAVFAVAIHFFETMIAAMTCVVVRILAPGHLPGRVAIQYVVGTLLFGFFVLRNLLRTVKEALEENE